ncbi:ADP-ribosylglycohydrolase family protein [Mycobacterium sp. M1]|uniref:ADP-ribosylglycohydrolase family protein n=1 Tax=Mycolicibacter acidiphilus TaxID=2835306 RepID=A0ABS5RMG0_9MYCO|nr:ADP-ribosylglycohydrolase family protein [Mycolicibacter acidiphilus]MBS9535492.1 ADP-ribosylglycohydrolase family protein [Mycolicibacter acidiphilus]
MRTDVITKLTTAQRDRACGALLGLAAADTQETGRWSDHTATAVAVAEIAATGAKLHDSAQHERIAQRWHWWAQTVKGEALQHVSLAASVPVALAYLHDEARLAAAARAIAGLIDDDPATGDAWALWADAVRHAVLTGEFNIRVGTAQLDQHQGALWAARFAEAEHTPPSAFDHSSAIGAVQGAWSAIARVSAPADRYPLFPADHLRLVLEAGAGAAAGGLLGAVHGASAVPFDQRLALHGWPGLRSRDVIGLAERIVGDGDRVSYFRTEDQPYPNRHPHDDGVFIGGVGPLARPSQYVPDDVDAIVSLCPIVGSWIPAGTIHLDVRLAEDENPNLDFVLLDTVRAVEHLRGIGRTVFLHGLHGHSRTPAVAALYGARRAGIGIGRALRDVGLVLPGADPSAEFQAALHRIAGAV